MSIVHASDDPALVALESLVALQGGGDTTALLTAIKNAVDGLESLITATNDYVDGLEGSTDGLETLIGATNTALANGTQKTQVVDGSGNVAPSGDTSARAPYVRPAQTTSVDEGQNLSLSSSAAFQFASAVAATGVLFQADPGNTANVHLAYANTLTTGATGKGFCLVPGASVVLPVSNANQVFARTATATQNVRALAQ
jgi:hypothetical protein